MNNPHVIRSTYGSRGRVPVGMPISKPRALPIETHPWYFHPGRPDSIGAPQWFQERLRREFGSDIAVTWNPLTEKWHVWARAARVQKPYCQGWRLLFIHEGAQKQYLPLDERVFGRIYQVDQAHNGGGKQYFDRIIAEYERDRERSEADRQQSAIDMAMPFWDHSRISVSGCGPSNGSKFSTYHA